jgi:hypothetical protein
VIYSYNKTNEMHLILKFIFGIEFYMFRTVSLTIIRSLVLYTQQRYMSYRLCRMLASKNMKWIFIKKCLNRVSIILYFCPKQTR